MPTNPVKSGRFALSIRGQLFLVMFLTAMVAVAVGVVHDSRRYTEAVGMWAKQEVESVADALEQDFLNIAVLGDPDAAANLVSRLGSFSLINSVVLYSDDGDALFQYRREGIAGKPGSTDGQNDKFMLLREIRVQNELYGRVEIEASAARLHRDINDYYEFLGWFLVALIVLSAASAWYFQRFFTTPLLQLKEFMHSVASRREFGQRVGNVRSDEFGVVYSGVNELLDEMQQAQQRLADEYIAKEEALRARISAESASREKSAFLANMSHELRTPLNAIIGYSELLDEDALLEGNGAASADLKKIRAAGKHLLSLINDILDLSKIEAGKMSLDLSEFPVARLVDEVASMVQPLLTRSEDKLVLDVTVGDLTMFSDPLRLRQILFNLLSNACKFTRKGTITLSVREDGGRVTFIVRDSGVGMTPGEVKTLFQPFVQAESGGKKHEGTGLGLALCKRFCELLGGEIQVTSTPGQGTAFEFRLPQRAALLPPKE